MCRKPKNKTKQRQRQHKVGDESYSEDALARFRRDNVGIVFQAFHLIPTMSALENVAVPLEFASTGDAFARARESLAAVGLENRLDHYPAQLSGGEQQRVAVARAFAPRPRLLLADEPTGNLDPENAAEVIRHLAEFHRGGGTVVLVTHGASADAHADRTLRLDQGQLKS